MDDTIPISALPSATIPLNGGELVPLVQLGVTRKAPASAFGGGGGSATFSGARTYRNVLETLHADTGNTMTFFGILYDTDHYWSSGAPAVLTLPFKGPYRFTAQITLDANPAGAKWPFAMIGADTPPTQVARAQVPVSGTGDPCEFTLSGDATYPAGARVFLYGSIDDVDSSWYGGLSVQYLGGAISPPPPPPPPPPATAWVTAVTMGTLRTDGPIYVGGRFTVGAGNITITMMGRYRHAGDGTTHDLVLVKASTSAILATVNVDVSTVAVGQYAYAALGTPVVLTNGVDYYIASLEPGTGDSWGNQDTVVTTTAAAAETNLVYSLDGVTWTNGASDPGKCYGPVNFKYLI